MHQVSTTRGNSELTRRRYRKPQETEPQITIDPREPSGDHWLFAEAPQGDVQARIAVRPHPQYREGYVLWRTTERVNEAAPGKMGRKQEARAKALPGVLEARLLEALLASGWYLIKFSRGGHPSRERDREEPRSPFACRFRLAEKETTCMQQKRAYQYRCYPTPSQRQMLARTFGCVRFVYNWALALRRDAFRERGEHLFYSATSAALTALKRAEATAFRERGLLSPTPASPAVPGPSLQELL
jgi:hypothetical protein